MTKLNSCGAAAENDLTELISDYFCGDNDNESSSDSDCDSDMEIPNSDLDDSFIPGNVLADDTDDDSADLAPSLVSVNDAGEFMPEKSVGDFVSDSPEVELDRIQNCSCNCQHNNKQSCSSHFSSDILYKRRLEMKELSEGMNPTYVFIQDKSTRASNIDAEI